MSLKYVSVPSWRKKPVAEVRTPRTEEAKNANRQQVAKPQPQQYEPQRRPADANRHVSRKKHAKQEPRVAVANRHQDKISKMPCGKPKSHERGDRELKPNHRCSVCRTDSESTPFPSHHKHIRDLGKGGEGVVKLWQNTRTGQLIVAKKLMYRSGRTPYEAKMLMRMPKFERIVSFLGVESDSSLSQSRTILLEYCNAGDLNRFYKSLTGQCSESFIWHVFKQLSEAIAFIHNGIGVQSEGHSQAWTTIIHRDIKPSNVLLTSPRPGEKFPNIRLGDFGLAKCFSPSSTPAENNSFCGTPPWQAPEIPNAIPASDVWAIGAIVHYLALGKPPIRTSEIGPARIWIRDNVPLCVGRKDAEKLFYVAKNPRSPQHINVRRRGKVYSSLLDYWMMRALCMSFELRITASDLLRFVGQVAHIAIDLVKNGKENLLNTRRYTGDETDSDVVEDFLSAVAAGKECNAGKNTSSSLSDKSGTSQNHITGRKDSLDKELLYLDTSRLLYVNIRKPVRPADQGSSR
jgi:serine/threonine protein kinase